MKSFQQRNNLNMSNQLKYLLWTNTIFDEKDKWKKLTQV